MESVIALFLGVLAELGNVIHEFLHILQAAFALNGSISLEFTHNAGLINYPLG